MVGASVVGSSPCMQRTSDKTAPKMFRYALRCMSLCVCESVCVVCVCVCESVCVVCVSVCLCV